MNYNIIKTGPLSGLHVVAMGYNYNLVTNVFLSSYSVTFPSLTSINNFTTIKRVSAICPAFSGYEINSYSVINANYISVSADTSLWSGSGYVDIIFLGVAGYTKLSDKNYLINHSPTNLQITTIDGDYALLSIDGSSYLVYLI